MKSGEIDCLVRRALSVFAGTVGLPIGRQGDFNRSDLENVGAAKVT